MNKLKGFTFIELMIVVVIIGVLAAVAIPAYRDYVSENYTEDGVFIETVIRIPQPTQWCKSICIKDLVSKMGDEVDFIGVSQYCDITYAERCYEAEYDGTYLHTYMHNYTMNTND